MASAVSTLAIMLMSPNFMPVLSSSGKSLPDSSLAMSSTNALRVSSPILSCMRFCIFSNSFRKSSLDTLTACLSRAFSISFFMLPASEWYAS